MKERVLKDSGLTILFLLAVAGLFYHIQKYFDTSADKADPAAAPVVAAKPAPPATTTPPYQRHPDVVLDSIRPTISPGIARVTAASPKVFAYAHGTVEADGKFFVGMANKSGNAYSPKQLTIFGDEADLSRPALIEMPEWGDIQTMVYDPANDEVYFLLSNNEALKLYGINPHTYALKAILSTTTVDVGRKPAIVSDGSYVYGITDTDPSTVFKVRLADGALTVSRKGHIPAGHSAAIARYVPAAGTSTELYFGGGMSNGFEKADAETLAPIRTIQAEPCSMSDDMSFVRGGDASESGGYVYIGCEMVPYGLRIRTSDMSVQRFSLPGGSFGLFAFGRDIYNAAQDGYIDMFPGGDLNDLRRYRVTDDSARFDTKGQDLEVNELLYSPLTGRLYFTAWLGIPGLYQVATSTQ